MKASAVLQFVSVCVVTVAAAACVGIAPTASTQPTAVSATATPPSLATPTPPAQQTPTVTFAPPTAAPPTTTASAVPSATVAASPSASAAASATAAASPTGPITLVDGTASVTVSGDANETFELSTDQVGTYTPGASSSVVEATWSNEDLSRLMRLTIDVDAVGVVPARSAFVAIGLGGSSIVDETTYFPDAFRSTCMVIVLRLDATGLEGSFTCTDLTSVDESQTIDAQGTFAAAAAAPIPTSGVLAPPTTDVSFTSGAAQVATTGDVEQSVAAELTPSTSKWTADGQLELHYSDTSGNTLLVRLRVSSGVDDQFVAVGVPGSTTDDATYFPDGGHTQCIATLQRFDSAGLDGVFTCTDVPNLNGDMTIDATGTFSATP